MTIERELSKEFKLESNFTLRQSNKHNAIFKAGKPIAILNHHDNVYNSIFDFKPKAKSIVIRKDKIIIDFIIKTKEFEDYDFSEFYVNIGYKDYKFNLLNEFYHLEIPYDSIEISGKSVGIYLTFRDKNGFSFKKRFLSMNGPHKKNKNHNVYTSKIQIYNNNSVYIYENWAGYLTLAYREVNVTDSSKEQKKITTAFLKQKVDSKLGRNMPSILIYEKFCDKYEESGKYIYQKLIDDGCENVYFVLDKDSKYYKEVPDKYKKNIINKYSFKHYYEYFNAKAFISTESFFHAIEVTNSNSLIRRRQRWENYYYFFLQHGVMYGYSLKGRNAFIKGIGFTDNSYVVVSSEKEADHFIDDGKFDREDLIKSGLPKFDHAKQNKDADKILIMPTTRNFEYSTIRDDTKNSTYYKFSKKIIESVPDELKDKIVYIPHPIVMSIIGKTDLEQYMPKEAKYDELLRNTRLLITDYSSISFDAFYRGCNVIFAWMEKEMCLNEMKLYLMLNDDNAFADIAYDYINLTKLISKNYYESHSEENTRKYHEIVEFNDNKNTERFVNYLYETNLFPNKAKKAKIADAEVEFIKDYPYKGKKIRPKLKISYNGKKLIKNLDYIIEYQNNINIGTATIQIKGKGIYSGTKSINFNIKKDMNNCEFGEDSGLLSGDISTLTEDGNQTLAIIDDGKLLEEKIDYICEIEDYEEICVRKIIIKGIGSYSGEKSILLDIAKN